MKICCTCKEPKNTEEFSFKKKAINLRQSYCKECAKGHRKKQYEKNKEYYIAHAKKNNPIYYKEVKLKIKDYLDAHPCVDCGEKDIVVLEFDHVRGKKLGNVSSLISRGWRIVKEEIDKCDVRCSNCHRRKTAKQFGWMIL